MFCEDFVNKNTSWRKRTVKKQSAKRDKKAGTKRSLNQITILELLANFS